MFKNYIKITWRNIRNNRGYAAINIFGLAFGLASCLIISLYVWDQISYDAFHVNANRIYRVVKADTTVDTGNLDTKTPPILADAMKQNFPGIEATSRLWNVSGELRRVEESRLIREDNILYSDNAFFEMFSFDLVQGNTGQLLTDPFSIVLTEKMARKYFPGENPINKQLILSDSQAYTITGIVANPPSNSSIKFNFLLSFSSLEHPEKGIWMARDAGWRSNAFETYFMLKEDQDISIIQNRFREFLNSQTDIEFVLKNEFRFEKFKDLHLFSHARNGVAEVEDIQYVYLFTSIAVLILLIAFINYVNLATARSIQRAREVGVRKVSGAQRSSLIFQFLGEALILALISFITAIFLVELLLPWVESLFDISFATDVFENIGFLAAALGASLFAALIAGLYPALYLSAFNPVQVLYNRINYGRGPGFIRRGLVTVQVIVFSGLIIGSYIIYTQMQYAQQRNLVTDMDQIFTVIIRDPLIRNNPDAFENKVEQLSGVKSASVSKSLLYRGVGRHTIKLPGKDKWIWITDFSIDEDFIETMNLEIVEGRDIVNTSGDVRSALINETAAEVLGWKESVGKILPESDTYENEAGENVKIQYRVEGVVKDFHYQSLKKEIEPIFMVPPADGSGYYLTVKTSGAFTKSVLDGVRNIWDDMTNKYQFDYFFLDDAFAKLYAQERRTGRLFGVFTIVGILIACLGLLSLSAYISERKTKEIGIRKVLGATVLNIISYLGTDFLKLIFLGFLISVPLSWYGMNLWLKDFAYKIEIGAGIFILTGGIAIIIAMASVSLQSIRAALANPVESLRSE